MMWEEQDNADPAVTAMLNSGGQPLNMLARVVTGHKVRLTNDLSTRRVHPSYGITKADLRETLHNLYGAAAAAEAVRTGFHSASTNLAAVSYCDQVLGFDLTDLAQQVREA